MGKLLHIAPQDKNRERDQKITVLVLRGYTLYQVGDVFSLSHERIRQIVNRTIRICDSDLYQSLISRGIRSIREYRKYKNRLMANIAICPTGPEG